MTIYRGIEKVNQELTVAEYDGQARPGEVVTAQIDPSAPDFAAYLADANGNLHPLGGGGGNGSAAGSSGQLQFNSLGNFGASPNLTFDTGNAILNATYGNFSGVVAGDLSVTSSAGVQGDLLVGGDLKPIGNVTSDLGSPTNRWNDLYLSNNTIFLGATALSAIGNTLTVAGQSVVTETANGSVSLDNLTVTGAANLGSVANLTIAGGSNGQVLTTDGAGDVSWTTVNNVANAAYAATAGSANTANTATSATTAATVTTAAQPNITSVGALSALTVTGNATAANVVATGALSGATLVTTGAANVGTTLTVLGQSAFDANVFISGNLDVTGAINSTSGNVIITDDLYIELAGNAANAVQADGAGILINGANIDFTYSYAQNAMTLSSALNVSGAVAAASFAGNGSGLTAITGANVTGTVANATYAAQAGAANTANSATTATSATTAGTVTTTAQPNITSVGTLTGLTVSGDTSLGSVTNVTITGGSNAQVLTTDGAGNLSWTTVDVTNSEHANVADVANSVSGANVTGTVANAAYATSAGSANTANSATSAMVAASANAVAGANVSGTVANATFATSAGSANTANSATVAASANSVAAANITGTIAFATLAGTANAVAGANVTGTVANAAYAATAGSANTANTATSATTAATANAVAGANVTGTVANATFATSAATANTANSATTATTAATVTTAAQPNITSVGTLANLTVSGVSTLGAVGNVKITGGSNAQVLTTDGTGNLSWATSISGSPAGNTGDIQINNGGAFGTVTGFQYDSANSQVVIPELIGQNVEFQSSLVASGEMFTFGAVDMSYANSNPAMAVAADPNVAVRVYGVIQSDESTTTTLTVTGNATVSGTGSNIIRRASGLVAGDTYVTLDDLSANVSSSTGQLGLFTSGTWQGTGWTETFTSGTPAVQQWTNLPLSTGYATASGAMNGQGNGCRCVISDQTPSAKMYQITAMRAGTTGNMWNITIERLV